MIEGAKDPVVRFRTVGLALTLQCNFSCGHCITRSGPRTKGHITRSDAEALVREIAKESNSICFTGGESLLARNTLLHCVATASEIGLTPTLVTNAYWAKDEAKTRDLLTQFSESGLKGICVSLDRFHLKFTNAENAFRVVRISQDLGMNHAIRLCRSRRDKFADTILHKHHDSGINFQIAQILRLGRASDLPKSYFKERRTPPPGRCTTVLAPLVLPDGSVHACCGPGMEHFTEDNPLDLGNWRREDLSSILRRARSDYLVMAIANLGPLGLTNILRSRFGNQARHPTREKYTGICDVCLDLCNDKNVVSSLREAFHDEQLRTKLIAGQVYIQSLDVMHHLGFLELPNQVQRH